MSPRPALAVIVTVALAAGGVTACGSSSSDESPAPQEKPAGLKNGGNASKGTKKG